MLLLEYVWLMMHWTSVILLLHDVKGLFYRWSIKSLCVIRLALWLGNLVLVINIFDLGILKIDLLFFLTNIYLNISC